MNKYLEKLAQQQGLSGTIHGTGRSIQNRDLRLEKSAANAYKSFLAGKGVDVAGISGSSLWAANPGSNPARKTAGSFSTMSRTADKLGLMPSARPSVGARVRQMAGAAPVMKTTGKTLSTGAKSLAESLKASGTSLSSVLQSRAAQKAAPAAGLKGIASRALSLAKKHPLLAAGGALATGVAVGRLSKGGQQPSYTMYQ